jgi:nucleoid DNA-binding protein
MASKKKAKKKETVKKATVKGVSSPMSKSALFGSFAETTGMKRKDIVNVFDALTAQINGHVKKGAAGIFTLPGLLKIKVINKPATKARKGINPFTGEPAVFKAKPARRVVKVLPLKALKEMVK